MAEVKPFRGIHYDVKRVGDLTQVVAPPYDVISPEEQEALHRRHPKNITWVDFGMAKKSDGPGENKYTRAAAWFREWLAEGTLVRDAAPSLYYYEQEFTIPGKRTYVRKGFLGALKLSAFGEGEVFPHERTLSKPKEDRLALMRVTDVHMSPIFALYSDPEDEVLKSLRSAMAVAPDMAAVDDLGVQHRVWTVSQPKALLGAVEGMKGKGIFIADGHHRYETALAFRDEMRKKHGANPAAAYEHVLMFLCNMDDEGIVILPTHRGVHSLAGFSADGFLAKVRAHLPVVSRDGTPEDAMRAVEAAGEKGKAIGSERGRKPVPRGHLPGSVRFLRQVPLEVPAAATTARRRAPPRVPPGAAPRNLPRGGDRGGVREVLQGSGQGGEGSIGRRDPDRLLHERGDDPRVPRRLPVRPCPSAEVDLLLPEDRDGTANLPPGADDRVPG